MLSLTFLIFFTLRNVYCSLEVPKWNFTFQEIFQETKNIISDSIKFYDSIGEIKRPSIANLLIPTIKYENDNAWREAQIAFYKIVSPDRKLRYASSKAIQLLEENTIEIGTRENLFTVYNKLWEEIKNDPEATDEESWKYLEKIIKTFKNSGFGLSFEKRNELRELQIELSNLSLEFLGNINENNRCIWFTKEELEGVPQLVMPNFETSQKDNETIYEVHLMYSEIIPLLKYGRDQETRKTALLGNMNKDHENVEIFAKIIGLRLRIANLLGYKSYSEFVLEENMTKTPENVMEFLKDLRVKLYPLAKAELEKKLKIKNEDLKHSGLPEQDKLYAWDDDFYTNRLLENEYKVDQQKILEYFPLNQTIENILKMYEKVFDVRFIRDENPEPGTLWHKDVQRFAVYQNIQFGEPKSVFMGWLLLDLIIREGKFRQASVFPLHTAYIKPDGTREPSITALICNFPKSEKGSMTLLKHSDVVTFFHELGHGMHHLLSQTKNVYFQGPRVAKDFVECPSQVSEFWAWSKDVLKQISVHFQTGNLLPEELIDNLIRSKHANMGLENFIHLLYSMFDMTVHMVESKEELEGLDIKKFWRKLLKESNLVSNGNYENIGYTTFGHLVSGYESGYYGYLYSKVFASDIYYTLFKADPMNVANGLRYRDVILKNGGAKHIPEILEELLGRKPSPEAFLKETLGKDC